ncbi:MAG: hypothetical protein R2857_10440 [Vampirovibrionales bacterium]
MPGYDALSSAYTFSPEEAFAQVQGQLRATNSLNYRFFRRLCLTAARLRQRPLSCIWLKPKLKQPQTGEGFEAMSLSEILVTGQLPDSKGILNPHQRGCLHPPRVDARIL